MVAVGICKHKEVEEMEMVVVEIYKYKEVVVAICSGTVKMVVVVICSNKLTVAVETYMSNAATALEIHNCDAHRHRLPR